MTQSVKRLKDPLRGKFSITRQPAPLWLQVLRYFFKGK